MILINQHPYDLNLVPQAEILKALDEAALMPKSTVLVKWFNLKLNQDEVAALYLPLVEYAQAKGLKVDCLMSQEMSGHLVRYRKLMFVDPRFLRRFKFNKIEFTTPYLKDVPHRVKE